MRQRPIGRPKIRLLGYSINQTDDLTANRQKQRIKAGIYAIYNTIQYNHKFALKN